MLVASPIFLIALVPWTALVLWLLLGKRRRVNVSFLELWKGPVTGPTARRRIGMPPLALIAALASLLLMILAAARPGIHRAAGGDEIPIVIVVDHGLSMSAGKMPRFAVLFDEIKPVLRAQFRDGPVQTVPVPPTESRTAIDTRGMLESTVRQQLELHPASPVIVLTDQDLHLSDNRLLRVSPQTQISNISIARIAARITSGGQVMVSVRNRSEQQKTTLQVFSDDRQAARQEVDLPPRESARAYFLPVDAAARVIRVQIEADDDFAGDNAAFLVRRGLWPIIETRTPVFAELQRLIEKYSRLRPPGDQSKHVGIVSIQDAGADPQIILPNTGAPASGDVSVADHPITASVQNIDWKKLAAAGIAEPAGDGWKPLVQIGGKTALAAREMPSRQVCMGLQTQSIANTADFVILWTNIFNWTGQGGEEFVAQTTGDLDSTWTPPPPYPTGLKPGWWPGVYRRSDGALLAVNAPDVPTPQPALDNWKIKLAELAKEHRVTHGVRPLTTALLLAAMLLMLLAAITWRGGLKKLRQPQPAPPQHATV